MNSCVVAAAVTTLVTGCAAETSTGQAAADCTNQVRLDGRVYSSYAYTDRSAQRYGQAEQAECHDTGDNPAGSVFPDEPSMVTVWSFDGYPPEDALGVRFDEGSFAVYVADSVPRKDERRIYRELNPQR
jgi:hypothetical protein